MCILLCCEMLHYTHYTRGMLYCAHNGNGVDLCPPSSTLSPPPAPPPAHPPPPFTSQHRRYTHDDVFVANILQIRICCTVCIVYVYKCVCIHKNIVTYMHTHTHRP